MRKHSGAIGSYPRHVEQRGFCFFQQLDHLHPLDAMVCSAVFNAYEASTSPPRLYATP
jgi:hypothetical protein